MKERFSKMKSKFFGILQRVGRSFMLPIAILPVAGLLLGIGSSFTNPTTLETYNLTGIIHEGGVLYTILDIMSKTGGVIFDNLALLFAIGVAIGMAKKEKEVAALSGAVAFLIMNMTVSALIAAKGGVEALAPNSTAQVLGITTLQMGVFGGIIVGLGVGALHNRFYRIKLPQVLSFFGGTRFVPIISSLVYLLVGILMFFVWPVVQGWIASLGNLVLASGYAGTWIYGIIERALIPFGLHHVFYMPFWQTEVGGAMLIDGTLVQGAQNIFFAELASKSTEQFSVSATRFMSGKFPFMIFGLPAAALAMYRTARPEKRKIVGGLLLSAALTAMLTGITEPIEFTFLFVSPILYVIHCILAGLSYMLTHIFGVGVGMTFSGGIIDLTLFGILQGNAKTNWVWIIVIGAVYALVYYFLFSIMIRKLNLKTPGREADDEETKLYTRADVDKKRKAKNDDSVSAHILIGLGGKDNIRDIDCCATRLRVTVKDGGKVDESHLKSSGASGIVKKGDGVQIIYGPQVSVIKSNFEIFMDSHSLEDAEKMTGGMPKPLGGNENQNTPVKSAIISAPLTGTVLPLDKVPDEAFSTEVLGLGGAIVPREGKLYAPFDGTVQRVFDTLHAVTLRSHDGCELLLHIGIDTVKLKGKHFESHIEEGQTVKRGDLLISFDIEKIKGDGYAVISPVVVCNSDEYSRVELTAEEKITVGDNFLNLTAKGD